MTKTKGMILGIVLALIWGPFPLAGDASANSAAFIASSQSNVLPDLVEKILPGVVNISSVRSRRAEAILGLEEFFGFWGVPRESPQSTLGSGFVIDALGYIMTNHHVIAQGGEEFSVTFHDKKQYRAKVIGSDAKLDVALLKIRDFKSVQPTTFGNSDAVRIAEPVLAIGNPFGLQHTVTMGIISAKNRTIGAGPFDNFLQTDASINPGNSGGPLFNLKGEVIGINTAIFSRTGQSGGLGFAIPANEAKSVIPDLKKYGHVPRPWIGVLGQQITPPLAIYYDLPVDKGVLIVNLVNRGPADRVGLKQGDIIVAVDGTSVSDNFEVDRALNKKRPKEMSTLKIRRGRKSLDIPLKLEELPTLANLPQGIL